MRGHRKLLVLFVLLVITAAIGFVVYQRIAKPPRAVLLLPNGNFLFYLNFAPAHFFDFGKIPADTDPEYQDFVGKTGFHFEHDLDTIAISEANPGDPTTSDSAVVFTGRFDQSRLANYLRRLAGNTENYSDKTIYSLESSNHVVRACIVDSSTVAVTSGSTPESMHSIIDKAAGFRLNPKGPELADVYYRYVPIGSLAWAMLRAPADLSTAKLPEGVGQDVLQNLDFLQDTVSLLSVRYTGSISLKLEVFSKSDTNAKRVTETVSGFLVLGRTAINSLNPGGADKDVKAAFDSIQVEQKGERTVISLVIPQEFLNKLGTMLNH